MILAIDVGNSNTAIGLFEGHKLTQTWRIESSRADLLRFGRKQRRPVEGAIASSVVPALKRILIEMSRRSFGQIPLFVGPKLKMPIRVGIKNPGEVGADRIVNAVAAYSKYRGRRGTTLPLLVIDFGTATTFDVVSSKGVYLGGAIVPGLKTSMLALSEKCSRLPRVLLKKPRRVIGRTTIEAIQSGIIFGYASLIEGMIHRIGRQVERNLKVIATGGMAGVIVPVTKGIKTVDQNLTLNGLKILYELNH